MEDLHLDASLPEGHEGALDEDALDELLDRLLDGLRTGASGPEPVSLTMQDALAPSTTPDAAGPWSRREDESPRAYQAFCDYRDMGAGRSLARLVETYAAERKRRQSAGEVRAADSYTVRLATLEKWSSQYAWQERTAAYDAHLELLARRRREDEYLRDLESLRDRQKKLSQASLASSLRLLQKANDRLQQIKVEEIAPDKLPAFFRAAAFMAEAATNAEAVSLGLHELMTLLDARDSDEDA